MVTAKKVGLGLATAVLLASMGGGFLLLPALLPCHVWAARRSGLAGRVGWALAAGLGTAEVAWGATYVLVGEWRPFIWLVPLAAGITAAALIARAASPAGAASPSPSRRNEPFRYVPARSEPEEGRTAAASRPSSRRKEPFRYFPARSVWAGRAAAAITVATAALYLDLIAHQGGATQTGLVAAVTALLLTAAVLAATGRRLVGAAAAILIPMGFLGIFSIGLPLLVAGGLAAGAAVSRASAGRAPGADSARRGRR